MTVFPPLIRQYSQWRSLRIPVHPGKSMCVMMCLNNSYPWNPLVTYLHLFCSASMAQKSPRSLFCTGFPHRLGKPYSSLFHTRPSRQQQLHNFMQRKHASVKTLNKFPKLSPLSTPIPAPTPNNLRTHHQKKHFR